MTPTDPLAGLPSTATRSSATRPEQHALLGWLLLAALGAAAAWLHTQYRWPLKLPGHHGLEWLAVLMAARLASQRPGAALAVALGAALATVAGQTGHGPGALLRPAIYLAQGLMLDALWQVFRGRLGSPWLALPAGAVVHAASPLIKLGVAAATAAVPGALLQGLAWPLASHAAFGAVGALLGAGAIGWWRHRRSGNAPR